MQIKTPTLKHTLYFIFSLWLIFLIWYGRGYFYDEAPDAGREAFYAGSNRYIPDETNAAVAIAGINAPENTDFIKRGRYVIDMNNQSFDFDDKGLSKKMLEEMPKLNFVSFDKADEIDCKQQDAIEIEYEQCTKPEIVSKLLGQNKLLLNRYFSLHKIIDWQGFSGNGQLLINLNRLLWSQNKLLISQGNYEKSYQLWRNNHVFISRVLGQESNMIDRAIFQAVDSRSLDSIEYLLYKNPETILKHADELMALLKPLGLARYNLKGLMRAEYTFINNSVMNRKNAGKAVHIEYMRNRMYRFHLDFLNRTHEPERTLSASERELSQKYSLITIKTFLRAFLPHGPSRLLADLLIGGQVRGLMLVKSMHHKSAMINLLNLSIKIRQQSIDANHIQTFLNKASKEYNCPFTEYPMVFDKVKKTIYCENPEQKKGGAEVRL